MPEIENDTHLFLPIVSYIQYDIDDIIEMKLIFKDEKEKEIIDMIKEDTEQLKSLALQTIDKMQNDIIKTLQDIEEYYEASKTHGYCSQLLRETLDRYINRLKQ